MGCCAGRFGRTEAVCVLRSYLRQRSLLIEEASRTIHHMQKALEHMNLKLTEVVSDIDRAHRDGDHSRHPCWRA